MKSKAFNLKTFCMNNIFLIELPGRDINDMKISETASDLDFFKVFKNEKGEPLAFVVQNGMEYLPRELANEFEISKGKKQKTLKYMAIKNDINDCGSFYFYSDCTDDEFSHTAYLSEFELEAELSKSGRLLSLQFLNNYSKYLG